MTAFHARLNAALKYTASHDDVQNLLAQMHADPTLATPGAVHRLVTADALDETGREPEARLLRSDHDVYLRDGKVYRHRATPAEMKQFGNAYAEAALWASDDPDTGEPLDENFTPAHFDADTKAQMKADAAHFLNSHYDLIGGNYAQAGHDFWLSRNGHGAGFFDGDNHHGENADRLHEEAHKAGEYELTPYPMPTDNAEGAEFRIGGYGQGNSADWGQAPGLVE